MNDLDRHMDLGTQQLKTAIAATPTPAFRPPARGLNAASLLVVFFVGTLLVGGLAWALLGSEPQSVASGPLTDMEWHLMVRLPAQDDADSFLAEIEAIPGATVVEYFPDDSVLFSEPPPATMVAFTLADGSIDMAAVLLTLEDIGVAEKVAAKLVASYQVEEVRYSEEIGEMMAERYFEFAAKGAAVIGEDPLILQPSPGPEPKFDTTDLGTEVDFMPATSVDEIPDYFWTLPEFTPELNGSMRSEARPVLHIGHLADIDARLLVFGTVSGGRCEVILQPPASGLGCGDFARYPYDVYGFGGEEGEIGYSYVVVPEATSAVTISFNGAGPLWQRPVAGLAMFPSRIESGITYAALAYDATGAVIGHWEGTS